MATNIQRTAAICDAIINATSTTEQQTLLAQALYSPGLSGRTYDQLTNAEKAAIIPAATRAWAIARVRDYNQTVAVRAAVANLPDPEAALPET